MDVLSKAPPNDRRNSAAVLADLAGRAGKLYRRSSEDWLACANLLLEARKVCPHGEWSAFLEDAGHPPTHGAPDARLRHGGRSKRPRGRFGESGTSTG